MPQPGDISFALKKLLLPKLHTRRARDREFFCLPRCPPLRPMVHSAHELGREVASDHRATAFMCMQSGSVVKAAETSFHHPVVSGRASLREFSQVKCVVRDFMRRWLYGSRARGRVRQDLYQSRNCYTSPIRTIYTESWFSTAASNGPRMRFAT